jgi:hypothetical protein
MDIACFGKSNDDRAKFPEMRCCYAVQKPIYLLLLSSSGVLVSVLNCRSHRVDEGMKSLDLI